MCTQVTNQSKESQLHLKIVRLSHSYNEIVLIIHNNFLSAYFELKHITSKVFNGERSSLRDFI